jgi:hypothetical protein
MPVSRSSSGKKSTVASLLCRVDCLI